MDGNQRIDEIDAAVQEIWNENPGCGLHALQTAVQQRLNMDNVSKNRIKTAKALLPYRRIENSTIDSQFKHTEFVTRKLQERQSLRMHRRFEQADHIHRGLHAMSIVVDDIYKTWTVETVAFTTDAIPAVIEEETLSPNGVPCHLCGLFFASRNLLFRHIRDPASGCGTQIFASGQSIPEPPSRCGTDHRTGKSRRAAKTGQTATHASAENCVWIGDLPLPWSRRGGKYKRLRAILFSQLPRDIPTPWIKTVVRKAYRSDVDGEYRGYAIVVGRDAKEALSVREILDNREIDISSVFRIGNHQNGSDLQDLPAFRIKTRAVDKSDTAAATTTWTKENDSTTWDDVPLIEQLRPLDTEEILRRIDCFLKDHPNSSATEWHPKKGSTDDECPPEQTNDALMALFYIYEKMIPRRHVHLEGRSVPDKNTTELLNILKGLRWPARNERQGISAERYLVLQTNVDVDRFYGELRDACRNLMDWVDPEYFYSGIAVTKNFMASPHIDHRDQSYQYAIALGDFIRGGELCVEGADEKGEYVNIVNTHNRVVRIDGRHVHWVRNFKGGDRYSLIFYDTSDRSPKPVIESGVDLTFLQECRPAQ